MKDYQYRIKYSINKNNKVMPTFPYTPAHLVHLYFYKFISIILQQIDM